MVIILQLVSVIFLTILGGIVWQQRPKNRVHQIFFLFTVSLSLWILAGILSNLQMQQALIFNKLVFIFPLVLVWSAMYLTILLSKHKTRLVAWTGLSVVVVSTLIVFTDFVVAEIIERRSAEHFLGYDVERGGAYFLYIAYLTLIALIALGALFLRWIKARRKEKGQLSLIGMGLLGCLVSGLTTSFVLPIATGSSEYAQFSFVSGLIATIFFAYAIVRYDLFDIKLVAVRSVAYGGALLSLSAIYYFSAYLLTVLFFHDQITSSVSVSPVNIMLALALAFVFQPIKRLFDKITNDIFYRDNYKSEEFLAAFSTLLTSTVDLRGLLERASMQIAATLKSEQVFFFLNYTNTMKHHMSAGTRGHAKLPVHDVRMLDMYIDMSTEPIIATDLIDDVHVRKMLLSHRVALVMPLRNADAIVGYVLLGNHMGGRYTKRDLNMLLTISNELVIAIQNALSLHEIKELNATLQQRIDAATKELRSSNAQLKHLDEVKDEFMSMASHQLRTPLTSVKGYVSMVLDGDAGDITPQQRKLLGEAFNSSERMVRLIADFLNVSRLQTGRFTLEKQSADLQEIVRHEVDNLKLIAKSHDISLKTDIVRGPLVLRIDPSKVQQVIMNLVDNAVYYSPAHSTVMISLERVDDRFVEFSVVDQGIGVPVSEQAKLFTRFFRAKNARKQRPDGTGVGLYLAKKVVAAHGGVMIFHSEEGKGSTFGFRLPLSRLDKDTNDSDDKNNHQ